MTDIPSVMPSRFAAGDTLRFSRSLADYPAPTWSLVFELRNAAGAVTIEADADGSDHLVDVPPATTAGYDAGRYHWRAYASDGTDRFEIERGTVEIEPDFATAGAADQRSHVERVLDAIEAVIEGRASRDQESYSIAGRTLQRTPIPELLTLRDKYRAELASMRRAERLRRGLGGPQRVLVRLA